jgi:hypothetical protein
MGGGAKLFEGHANSYSFATSFALLASISLLLLLLYMQSELIYNVSEIITVFNHYALYQLMEHGYAVVDVGGLQNSFNSGRVLYLARRELLGYTT